LQAVKQFDIKVLACICKITLPFILRNSASFGVKVVRSITAATLIRCRQLTTALTSKDLLSARLQVEIYCSRVRRLKEDLIIGSMAHEKGSLQLGCGGIRHQRTSDLIQ